MSHKDKSDDELVEDNTNTYSTSASIEMMRRLKNSIEKLNEETSEYSESLLGITVLLFVVAYIQLFVSIETVSLSLVEKSAISLGALGLIFFAIKLIKKRRKSKK